MRSIVVTLFAILSSILPTLTYADVQTPSGKVIECYCTDRYGQRHEIGDIICLTVDSRSYMAKCVMAQNNPFWRDQKRGCLTSQNAPQPAQPMTKFPSQLAFLPQKSPICG